MANLRPVSVSVLVSVFGVGVGIHWQVNSLIFWQIFIKFIDNRANTGRSIPAIQQKAFTKIPNISLNERVSTYEIRPVIRGTRKNRKRHRIDLLEKKYRV